MFKHIFFRVTLSCVILGVVLCANVVQANPSEEDGIKGRGADSYSPLPKGYNGHAVARSSDVEPDLSQLFVKTITLKFLDARSLKAAIGKMVSERGNISIDKKSNSLIICETKEKLEKIIRQIKEADQTPEQIMVEVVIIDVLLNDATEIGVNWDNLFNRKHNPKYKQTLIDTLSTSGVSGGDFSILSGSISGTIHALQDIREVEILASPRVLVVSGQKARIKAITEIPYQEITQTGRGGGVGLLGAGSDVVTSTVFKEVGVILNVKATVTDEQKILMTIEPEQSVDTETTSPQGVPIIDTRTAKTTLLMDDDQIIVMGGMRRKDTSFKNKKVPFLGDLPLLGPLFNSYVESTQHSELVVMISPHIYEGEFIDEDMMDKYDEITERPLPSLRKDKSSNEELQSILNRLEKNISRELRAMAETLEEK